MSAICQLAFIIISACTITRQQHLQLYRNCCWSPDWSKYATNSASTKGRQTFSERIVVKVFDETDQCVWYLRRTLQSAMHWHLNSVAPTITERLAVILSQSRGKKASLKILQHSQWQLNLRHSKHTRKAFAATSVESALKILSYSVCKRHKRTNRQNVAKILLVQLIIMQNKNDKSSFSLTAVQFIWLGSC